jgi:hypothetical protein
VSFWDDEAGYDIRDYKHPDWSGKMLDLGDDLRKKRREEEADERSSTSDSDADEGIDSTLQEG